MIRKTLIQEKSKPKIQIVSIASIYVICFILLLVFFYNKQLEQEAKKTSLINPLLLIFMEDTLLKQDIEGLRKMVQKLDKYPDIHLVMIINREQEIRFSSDPIRLYNKINTEDVTLNHPFTVFQVNSRGENVLRTINPIYNQAACTHCHGSIAEQPVNGVLLIDYDAEPILETALYNTLLLVSIILFLGILFAIILWWFFIRQVQVNEIKPDISEIASKIAHDIYNPLTSVRLSLQGALRTLKSEPLDVIDLENSLQIADGEIDKCVEMTQRFLKKLDK